MCEPPKSGTLHPRKCHCFFLVFFFSSPAVLRNILLWPKAKRRRGRGQRGGGEDKRLVVDGRDRRTKGNQSPTPPVLCSSGAAVLAPTAAA
uniref:Secreted protein n=1 Tax=Globodera rostochiensis TaxID=31243 RepID=A0A914GYH2_GLORO